MKTKSSTILIGRQSGKAQNTFHDLMAMVLALLGINIENFALVRWQICRILQNLVILQRSRNNGGNVECLFALGFACGCAEIAQCADGRTVHPKNFGWHFISVRHSLDEWFSKGLQNPLSCMADVLVRFPSFLLVFHSHYFFRGRLRIYFCASCSICACVFTGF